MPKTTGTASEYVFATMREYKDNEMTLNDLFAWQGAEVKFTKGNIANTMQRLLKRGMVTRLEEDNVVWWRISPAGLAAGRPAKVPTDKREARVAKYLQETGTPAADQQRRFGP